MFDVSIHGLAACRHDRFLQEGFPSAHVPLLSLGPGDLGHIQRPERTAQQARGARRGAG